MRFFLTYLFLFTALQGIGQTMTPQTDESLPFTRYYSYVPSAEMTEAGLIIFLHGNGPKGDEVNTDVNDGFARILNEAMPKALNIPGFNPLNDYYIIAPHFHQPLDKFAEWNPVEVKEFIEEMIIKFESDDNAPDVDREKIILVGFSLGGKGAWDFGVKYPGYLAGLMPTWGSILESSPEFDWCNLKDTPIWAINGEEDPYFPVDGTSLSGRKGVNLIESFVKSCDRETTTFTNAPFVKTLLTGRNHSGWDEFFNLQMGYPVYEWILGLEKNKVAYPPLVSLGDDLILFDNNSQWFHYVSIIDPLNKPLNINWTVETVSGLDYKVNTTDHYIELKDFETGQYTITCSVTNENNLSHADEVTLTVLPASQDPGDIANIYMKVDGIHYTLQNDDIYDIRKFIDKASYNVYIENPETKYITSSINQTRHYNALTISPFSFQDGVRGPSGIVDGIRSDPFKLFSSGTRRLTYTFHVTNPFTIKKERSYQVSVWFTDDPDALPITLLSFTGDVLNNGVRLNWTTTDEVDNSHFEIFRGRTGADLEKVGETSKAPPGKLYNYYNFTDYEAREGIYYYQLQSVDLDGKRDLSDIIRVAITPGEELLAYPNPAIDGQFLVNYPDSEYQQPILYNSHGQAVDFSISPSPNGPGERQLTIQDPRPGMYVLQMMQQGSPVSLKVIVE